MKFKITLLVMAGLALASFNSCTIFVRGHGHGHSERKEHHEQSGGNYGDPSNNELQNSLAPSLLQPAAQLPTSGLSLLNFDLTVKAKP